MLTWIKTKLLQWRTGNAATALSEADRLCAQVIESHAATAKKLRQREAELAEVSKRLVTLQTGIDRDLEQAKRTFAQYETSLAAVRAELKVASDITIPTLTAAHRLLLSRYDAENSIQIRRQVAASINPEG